MQKIGKLIIMVGSLAAILYAPYTMLGSTYWGFIFGDIISAGVVGIPVYKHLDFAWLGGELVVINTIGLLLLKLK
jgi:hypothetical protein